MYLLKMLWLRAGSSYPSLIFSGSFISHLKRIHFLCTYSIRWERVASVDPDDAGGVTVRSPSIMQITDMLQITLPVVESETTIYHMILRLEVESAAAGLEAAVVLLGLGARIASVEVAISNPQLLVVWEEEAV